MVEVTIRGQTAVFTVLGLHKLLALTDAVVVPLAQIRSVRAAPDLTLGWWHGWRMPGTHVPGLIVAGTFYKSGRRVFWDVVRTSGAIVVDLSGASYDQLVVEVADPEGTVKRLQAARGDAAA